MGSGAVGVEFASIFRRFGSEVTILELLPRLVPVEDEAVSAELEKSFRKQGITAHTGAKVTSARGGGDGVDVEAQLADGSDADDAGRVPARRDRPRPGHRRPRRRAASAPAREGLHQGRRAVPDQRAGHLGDRRRHHARRAPHPQLAHVSSAEGIVAAERIAGHEARPINYDHVPGCTYCDPEIGSVGLTEREAQERGFDVRVGTFPFGVLGRAKMAGETEGFVKIVADKKYDEVLGVHMIGPRSTELVAEATRGAAARVDGRRADSHDSRAPDDGRSRRRGGARRARRGDTHVNGNWIGIGIGLRMRSPIPDPHDRFETLWLPMS